MTTLLVVVVVAGTVVVVVEVLVVDVLVVVEGGALVVVEVEGAASPPQAASRIITAVRLRIGVLTAGSVPVEPGIGVRRTGATLRAASSGAGGTPGSAAPARSRRQ